MLKALLNKNLSKMILNTIVLSLLLISISNAQLSATKLSANMGRGINLGNTLDARNYEGGWAPAAEEKFFDAYKDAGFQTIRIPITWDAAISKTDTTPRLSRTAPYNIEEEFFKRLDTIINWGLDRQLIIIINSHHDAWIKDNYNSENKTRFDALWQQISERYKDYSDSLVFEILNEPHTDVKSTEGGITKENVEELMKNTLATIRKTNPTRKVIYTGDSWGNSEQFLQSNLQELDDQFLIGTYHSYDPSSFGLDGNGTWGTDADIQTMIKKMQSIYNFTDSTGIPVLLGEFGAVQKCDFNSRMKYYAYYVKIAMSRKIPFTVWDDHGWFKILNRESSTWDLTKDILINYDIKSPKQIELTLNGDSINISWENVSDNIKSTNIQLLNSDEVFETIDNVNSTTTSYVGSINKKGSYQQYRIANILNDESVLYSYPQEIFIPPTERSSFGDNPFIVPGSFEAEDFDIGGQTLTYYDNSAINEAKNDDYNYRPDDGVDLEPIIIDDVFQNNYQISYANTGEWTEYTIDVQDSGNYKVTFTTASMDGGGILRFQTNNSYYIDTKITATNSWTTSTDVTSVPITLCKGIQYARLSIISDIGSFNIDKISLEKTEEVASVNSKNSVDNGIKVQFNSYNKIAVLLSEETLNNASLKILDTNGKTIIEKNISGKEIQINLGSLNNGFYILKIKNTLISLVNY